MGALSAFILECSVDEDDPDYVQNFLTLGEAQASARRWTRRAGTGAPVWLSSPLIWMPRVKSLNGQEWRCVRLTPDRILRCVITRVNLPGGERGGR